MVRRLCIVAVLSLLAVPLALSESGAAEPPVKIVVIDPEAGVEVQLPFDPDRIERFSYRVAPDVSGVRGSWTCLARAGESGDEAAAACDVGRALSLMEPCTRPQDCRALDYWSSQVGTPSLRQARPLGRAPQSGVVLTRVPAAVEPASEPAATEAPEDEP